MKKFVFLSLNLAAVCIHAFATSAEYPISKPWENISQNQRVIGICSLSDQELNEIMLGYHPELAVEFSVGTKLPINFFFKGDLLDLVENKESSGSIEVKQSFYVRCVGKELIVSSDLTQWKPFLEYITGNFSITLNIQDGQPSIVIGVEANKRLE